MIKLSEHFLEIFAQAPNCRAWPFEEAKKLLKRYENKEFPEVVQFETGYGPSGLPHIGTFGEVARTTMVLHAFKVLTQNKVNTRLLCFSDDRDALRKIPENIPNPELLRSYLGSPLTDVPDPFQSTFKSFGEANNAKLRAFLDRFQFDYEFLSATEYYKKGYFNKTLLKMISKYDEIKDMILPTLGAERRQTYSPFLPIDRESGKILQVPIEIIDPVKGIIAYKNPNSLSYIETDILNGKVKCQWKADWALRWVALNIDYEMAGKDLIDSVKLSSKICRVLGGTPPEGFNYELFLDENGSKISKSKGNGLTIEQWLTYAPTESLSFYMYQKPKTAKKLHFDAIPKAVDEYYNLLAAWQHQDWRERLENPVWHIHAGNVPEINFVVPFSLLLNLVSASNAENSKVLWGYLTRYAPGATAKTSPYLDKLVHYALRYFNDFVRPLKRFRYPDDVERKTLVDVLKALDALPENSDSNVIQNQLLNVARQVSRYQDLKKKSPDGGFGVSGSFFQMLYEVLLGQTKGPRFGSFAALYGLKETQQLIEQALSFKLIQPNTN